MSSTSTPEGTGWKEQLYDGTTVWIRPINEHDADLELEFLHHLSPEFRGSRFLGLVRDPSPEVARELTNLDPATAMGFIAVVSQGEREREVGAAQFRINATGDSCDASLAVSGEWRKRGIGSLLMRRLVEAAKARGLRHMRANAVMHSESGDQLASRIGFQRRQDPRDSATVIYDLDLR